MRRRVAQASVDQGRACLRRSRVCAHPAKAEQRSVPAGPTNPARLLFAYFLLAKQEKVSRPPGRDPATSVTDFHLCSMERRQCRLGGLVQHLEQGLGGTGRAAFALFPVTDGVERDIDPL